MTVSRRDPLPTDEQRRVLCEMMACAFIEIRMLGWAGKAAQAADLADAFHNAPREMYGWGGWNRRLFRMGLDEYQRRYASDNGHRPYDYVTMFDRAFGREE